MPQPLPDIEFTVGNVLRESMRLYGDFFVRLVGLSVLVFGSVGVVGLLLTSLSSTIVAVGGLVFVVVGNLVGFFLVQAVVVVQTDDARDGRIDATVGQAFRRAWPFVGRLIALGLATAAAIGLAAGAILVLGWLAHVMWLGVIVAAAVALLVAARVYLATPVLVVEDVGPVGAIRRSGELVEDHGWSVFRLLAVTGGVSLATNGLVRQLLGSALHSHVHVWLASIVANSLAAPFGGLVATVSYFLLRPTVRSAASASRTASPPPARSTTSAWSAIPPGDAYRDEHSATPAASPAREPDERADPVVVVPQASTGLPPLPPGAAFRDE